MKERLETSSKGSLLALKGAKRGIKRPAESAPSADDELQLLKEELQEAKKDIKQLKLDSAEGQRQYSKSCLVVSGADLPPEVLGEKNFVAFAKAIRLKYGIAHKETDIRDVEVCHRLGPPPPRQKPGQPAPPTPPPRPLICKFNHRCEGSYYESITYRPENWDGEKNGNRNLRIRLETKLAKRDAVIKDALLFMRKRDRGKAKDNKRVVNVKIVKSGCVAFTPGKGRDKNMTDPEAALDMLSAEELTLFNQGGPGKAPTLTGANSVPSNGATSKN